MLYYVSHHVSTYSVDFSSRSWKSCVRRELRSAVNAQFGAGLPEMTCYFCHIFCLINEGTSTWCLGSALMTSDCHEEEISICLKKMLRVVTRSSI